MVNGLVNHEYKKTKHEVETTKAKPEFSSKSLLFLWLTAFLFQNPAWDQDESMAAQREKNKTSQVIYLNASFHIVTVFKNKWPVKIVCSLRPA